MLAFLQSRRRLRARRIALVLLVAACAIALVCATTRLDERLAGAAVGRSLGAAVTIAKLDWRIDGSVRAREVVAALPASPPFFGAERVDLELGLLPPRVVAVVLFGTRVVATERADGRIDLQELARGGERRGTLPELRVEGGSLELRGEGPLREQLRGVIAADWPASLAIERLSATDDGRGATVVRGAVRAWEVARIQLDGRARSGRLERFTARVGAADAVDLERLRDRLAPPIASWLSENGLAGAVAGEVAVDWMEGVAGLSAALDLLGVAVTPAVFPVPVADLRGRIRLRGGDLAVGPLVGRHAGAAVTISGRVEDPSGRARSHLVVRADSAPIGDELRRALAQDEFGRDLLAALAPEGRYSVTATIDSDAASEEPRLLLEIDLEECAGAFHGFADSEGVRRGLPVRIERIRGRVRAASEGTEFERCVGFTRGGARVEASARADEAALDGAVHAFDVPIDEELLAAVDRDVSPVVREVVALLGLSGRFDASALFSWRPERGTVVDVTLEPRAIGLRPPAFPFAVCIEGGRVVIAGDRVRLEALHGVRGSGSVRIDGEIGEAEDPGIEPPISIVLRARGIEIDPELVLACHALEDARVAEVLDRMQPRGRLDLEVRWERARTDAPLIMTVRVEPRDVRMLLGDGVTPASRVNGSVTFRRGGDGPVELDLESDGGIAAVVLDGRVRMTGRLDEEARGRLRLHGERLRIGEELQIALQPIAPELAALLASHGVDGRVRVDCELEPREGRLQPIRVDVEPDSGDAPDDDGLTGVTVTPPWLPLPVQWLRGVMRADLDARRVTFDRLTGFLGDAHLAVAGGSFQLASDGLTASLAAGVDGLPFTQWIELVFGAERQRGFVAYGPLGRTRIALRQFEFHLASDGAVLDRLVAAGDVDFDGWTFYTGGGLRNLTGRLEVPSLAFGRSAGGVADLRAEGRLVDVTLEAGALRFSDLDCDLLLRDGRLSVPWLSADFAGGRLGPERNHLTIALEGAMPFDGRFELESGDVSRVLGNEQPRMRGLVGRVDANVAFRGAAGPILRDGGVTGLEAAGTISIRDAKLWSIPIFDILYSKAVLPLVGTSEGEGGAAEPPKWNRGVVDFALQGVSVRLSKIVLEGEPLVLRGEGTLGPNRLSIHFYPEVRTGVGFLRDLPVLGWILHPILALVEREVGAFRFQGPYGRPEVKWDPVRFVPRPDLAIRLERPRTSTPRNGASPERF